MTDAPAIPGYALERLLGAGAHGRVWLARETAGLRRPVALKLFAPEHREAFARELEASARIEELRRRERAPGIVQALGSGEIAGTAWLALEYLEAGSLADRVARTGALPASEAAALVAEAGRALALLHQEGLFHRDVKPANLLVGADGRVRLGDFGLARPLDGTLSAAGSPAFAAPEVIAGKPSSGVLADVYSLGATLAFLVTGETILPGRPDVFTFERAGVPRWLQRTIVDATAADPRERTASVEAFLSGLVAKNPGSGRGNSGSRDEALGERPRGDGVSERANEPVERAASVAVRDDVGVATSALGCPWCHDAIAAEGSEWVACWACLARHHAGCWDERGRCATCGHDRFLPAGSAERTTSPLRKAIGRIARGLRVPLVGALLFFLGPALGLGLTVLGMTGSFEKIATLKSPTPSDLGVDVYTSLLATTGSLVLALGGGVVFLAWLVWFLATRVAPRARDVVLARRAKDRPRAVDAPPRTSRRAIASLAFALAPYPVTGLVVALVNVVGLRDSPLMIPLYCLPSLCLVTGLVLAVQARRRIHASEGALAGRGYATAAIIVATLEITGAVVATILVTRGR